MAFNQTNKQGGAMYSWATGGAMCSKLSLIPASSFGWGDKSAL